MNPPPDAWLATCPICKHQWWSTAKEHTGKHCRAPGSTVHRGDSPITFAKFERAYRFDPSRPWLMDKFVEDIGGGDNDFMRRSAWGRRTMDEGCPSEPED